MPVQIKVPDHILMPFGCPKWDKDQIQMASVGLDGTYFVSNTKCAYIDKGKKQPLRMCNFKQYFPDADDSFPYIENGKEAFSYAFSVIEQQCELGTSYERKFLQLYCQYFTQLFEQVWRWTTELDGKDLPPVEDSYHRLFLTLMPFPQAHLYARDPFKPFWELPFAPERMFKVDFAFWTGTRLVAVEIDGGSHIGSEKHIEKDRLLARAGVSVIHILNSEVDRYGKEVIKVLLPESITKPGFLNFDLTGSNPFADIPF